eukprot:1316213-Pyramimonas_sp.AAC.2
MLQSALAQRGQAARIRALLGSGPNGDEGYEGARATRADTRGRATTHTTYAGRSRANVCPVDSGPRRGPRGGP